MGLPARFSAAVICLVLVTVAWPRQDDGGELTFDLEEVSAFQVPGRLRSLFVAGQSVVCTKQPDPNVHRYPDFASGVALYGAVELPRGFLGPQRGRLYAFALDESGGTGTGYDRLYFDLDGDGDLTEDTPLAKRSAPPKGATLEDNSLQHQICFESMRVPLFFGEEGTRATEVMPRLALDDEGNVHVAFVSTTARKGRLKINGRTYEAWLGYNYRVGGSFDRPPTALHLIANGNFDVPKGWMSYQLCTLRRIGDTYYRFSATPTGDRLTARPYRGEFGTLQAGLTDRKVSKTRVRGMLASDREIVDVGGQPTRPYGRGRFVSHCRVPVGDYSAWLEIGLDDLRAEIWANIHADGRPKGRLHASYGRGIRIRKEEPFVLDFSNEPEVLFASPAINQRVATGEELNVYAVLTDPALDVMFVNLARARGGPVPVELLLHNDYRPAHLAIGTGCLVSLGLWGVSLVLRSKRRLTAPAAGLVTVLTVLGMILLYVSLRERSFFEGEHDEMTPQVTIARSNGEIVSQGLMPFY